MVKEVTLLAMGETRIDCPFDTETWGLNNVYKQVLQCYKCYKEQKVIALNMNGVKAICPECKTEYPRPRLDKLFLAHTQCWDADGDAIFNWADFNTLSDMGVEIINTHRVRGLKSTLYPMKSIVKRFGRNYFSDTIAYQLAYALYKGYNKINIYGADMHTYSEYAREKGGIEYWMGRADEMGTDIYIHPDSSLGKTSNLVPYGTNVHTKYCWFDEKGLKHEIKPIHKKPNFNGGYPDLGRIRTPNA